MKILIHLVPHGYEMEVWTESEIPQDKLMELVNSADHSECRDYGENIDVGEGALSIINKVRGLEDEQTKGKDKRD